MERQFLVRGLRPEGVFVVLSLGGNDAPVKLPFKEIRESDYITTSMRALMANGSLAVVQKSKKLGNMVTQEPQEKETPKVIEPPKVELTPAAVLTYTVEELLAMTKTSLKKLCDTNDLPYDSDTSKDDLAEVLFTFGVRKEA